VEARRFKSLVEARRFKSLVEARRFKSDCGLGGSQEIIGWERRKGATSFHRVKVLVSKGVATTGIDMQQVGSLAGRGVQE